jgi:outer membrane protein assembly factor BamB
VIYVTDQDGRVICISREAGQVYWISDMNKGKKPKQHAAWSGPVLTTNGLVVVSNRGELKSLDPETGAVKRTVNLRVKQGATLAPTPAAGMLYIATASGDLIALR